jgi:hypothetical protein
MEAVAEPAQRISAIKSFAIGTSDQRHGFTGLHNKLCFGDCICASSAARLAAKGWLLPTNTAATLAIRTGDKF